MELGEEMTSKNLPIDMMTPEQESDFWTSFEEDVRRDDGAAAREHLAAGRAVYQQTDDMPDDVIQKIYPDGRIDRKRPANPS